MHLLLVVHSIKFRDEKESIDNMSIDYDVPPSDRELPLREHLAELRQRVLVIFGGVALVTAVVLPFSDEMLRIMWSHFLPPNVEMMVYGPWEIISIRITLSLICAFVIGVPLLLYETLAFMRPGLYPSERRFLYLVVPFSLILFIAGAAIGYLLVVPTLFRLMISASSDVAFAQLSIKNTFSVVMTTIAGLGLVFQLPLLTVFAVKMGLVKYKSLVERRWLVYSGLLAFAMLATPDPTLLSQLVVAVMLVILFEFSLLIARFL
ncbi:MAG: twin-arginine translocase subunit TatC [Methanocellales archaeon]|nr:twin-arginine translocase subunit TatC [Methanocellales archaeon]MDD3291814.1 twin-arginine translocase subunit TatC [Methanocellales archaeon]MDD5234572.1 twin-arginine translocase subunit TatC [Methanocellales archaeon]MDD5485075.1 twin-arginine translocase subunit TatC [Methanocellales archaeon]